MFLWFQPFFCWHITKFNVLLLLCYFPRPCYFAESGQIFSCFTNLLLQLAVLKAKFFAAVSYSSPLFRRSESSRFSPPANFVGFLVVFSQYFPCSLFSLDQNCFSMICMSLLGFYPYRLPPICSLRLLQ